MSSNDFKNIFSKNLQYFMKQKNVSQAKLVEDLNLPYTTVVSWITGERLPRMDKVQLLSDYFGVENSALLEDWQDAKKAMQNYTSKWNALSAEERDIINQNSKIKLDKEQQYWVLMSILAIAEKAGPDYLDYFIDKNIFDFNRCEQMFNILAEELKLLIDYRQSK